MKKQILLLGVAALFIGGITMLSGCKNTGKKATPEQEQTAPAQEKMQTPDTAVVDTTQTAEVHYQCSMKCEGDKTYDKPGKCPKCGMEMVAVNEDMHEEQGETEEQEHQ